ncbi:MAG: glycerol-3-phosphate dehydrogenase, partial [Candidatus Azotimanducaceae bacterium]
MVSGMGLDASQRGSLLNEAQIEDFDLIIIGGGITGAGILREASLRGLSAVLIEAEDFASGTSSKSTKLIHGGLR